MQSPILPNALKLMFVLMPATLLIPPIVNAQRLETRQEIREGSREINEERREASREIRNADSPMEARHEIREGAREVRQERREASREVRRSVW